MADFKDFLGRGWGFPPSFNKDERGVYMVSDEEDIEQSLKILLHTQVGEHFLQPEFGVESRSWMFSPLSESRMRIQLEDAICEYEPRVNLERVHVESNSADGRVEVSVDYTIKASNSRHNLVYPFYLNEGTLI